MTGPADAYCAFYETLTPESVAGLPEVVSADVHFRDPFNDVWGIEAYRRVLVAMFEAMPDIRFTISHQAVDRDVCFLRWQSTATFRGTQLLIDGTSELRFAADGRVREHIDYWDAAGQFYEHLPVLGGILRLLRRRIAAHADGKKNGGDA